MSNKVLHACICIYIYIYINYVALAIDPFLGALVIDPSLLLSLGWELSSQSQIGFSQLIKNRGKIRVKIGFYKKRDHRKKALK